MGIGTSQGAFYNDEGHYSASMWDDKYDDNTFQPDTTADNNVVAPQQMYTYKAAGDAELGKWGPGMEVSNVVDAPYSGSNLGPLQKYDTPLTPDEETQFTDWKAKNAPNDSGADYDLRGAFINGINPAENGHFPDTYKKPNHPTFSEESVYSMPGQMGGKWSDEGKTFTPDETNLREHGFRGLIDYLKESDPDVKLNIGGTKLDYKQAGDFYNAVGGHMIGVNTPYNVFHSDIVNKLLGTNGEERYQLWPERMIRELTETAGKVAKGDVPMWAMDPETGEMHTSLDAMQSAWSMMAGANSGTNVMAHADMQARAAIDRAGLTGRMTTDEFKAGNFDAVERAYVRQAETPPARTPEQQQFEDTLSEIRQAIGDVPLSARRVTPTRTTQDQYLQEPYIPYGQPGYRSPINEWFEQATNPSSQRRSDLDAARRESSPPQLLREQGKIKLMTNPTGRGAYAGGGSHMYYFTNDKGRIGKVDVSIMDRGKELYIHGIAGVGGDRGPGKFGPSDIKDLLRALRKEHPGTTKIGGYRISGARAKSALDQGRSPGADAHSNFTESTAPE